MDPRFLEGENVEEPKRRTRDIVVPMTDKLSMKVADSFIESMTTLLAARGIAFEMFESMDFNDDYCDVHLKDGSSFRVWLRDPDDGGPAPEPTPPLMPEAVS